jgi:hypothetical protein
MYVHILNVPTNRNLFLVKQKTAKLAKRLI